MKVRIEESLCIACGLCREACPERAVHPKMQDIHHMYEVLENRMHRLRRLSPLLPGARRVSAVRANDRF